MKNVPNFPISKQKQSDGNILNKQKNNSTQGSFALNKKNIALVGFGATTLAAAGLIVNKNNNNLKGQLPV